MDGLTHVFFDFFGTLVAYSESRVDQGFPRSHHLLVTAGAPLDYHAFLKAWTVTCDEFERQAQESLDEYSMDDVCEAFLQRTLPRPPAPSVVAEFRDTYLAEWNTGVRYIPDVAPLLAELTERFTLGVVTNTHHADLVNGHLQAMNVAPHFTAVVTSIEHGKRKPSKSIFECALERSGGKASGAVYVGDSYSADYLGAVGAGVHCLLIDPERQHDVPPSARLTSVLDARKHLLR